MANFIPHTDLREGMNTDELCEVWFSFITYHGLEQESDDCDNDAAKMRDYLKGLQETELEWKGCESSPQWQNPIITWLDRYVVAWGKACGNQSETTWWFAREECGEFYAKLCADVNEASSHEWKVSNYHNAACGSVCFYLDNDSETYVQLHAFMTKEDADLEELDMFGITISCQGQTDYATYSGNDRDEACQRAAYFAARLHSEFVPWYEDDAEEEASS